MTSTAQEATAQVASAQAYDVSNYQGHYDWAAARRNTPALVLGISRVTQGLGARGTNSPDPDASWDWEQLKALGLDRGAYHFFDPHLDGAAQARYLVDTASKLPGGISPRDQFWLDNEDAGGLRPAVVAAEADRFMAELDLLVPHNPRGVYTFINFARDGYCAGLGERWLWLAYPSSAAPVEPPPWMGAKFVLWQWGQRDGTDADAFMGTVEAYNAWVAGFNPPKPPVNQGPYRQLANGTKSLSAIAAQRHTTAAHLFAVSSGAYTGADVAKISSLILPKGFPFYTTNP